MQGGLSMARFQEFGGRSDAPLMGQAAPWHTLQLGDTLLHGRYTLREQVATDDSGHVFTAHDRRSNELVHLRLMQLRGDIPEEVFARARQMIRRCATSPHPFIARVSEIDRYLDALVLVTEPRGQTLRQCISTRPLPLDEVFAYTRHVGAALMTLHAHDVTYGTLTPATIAISPSNDARLTDVGLSLFIPSLLEPYPTDINQCAGYLAPEERPDTSGNAAIDLYHFGAFVWEIALNSPPPARNPLHALHRRIDLHPALRDLITACMQTAPDARPTDLTSLLGNVRAAQRDLFGSSAPNALLSLLPTRDNTLDQDTVPRQRAYKPATQDSLPDQQPAVAPDAPALFPQHEVLRRQQAATIDEHIDYTLPRAALTDLDGIMPSTTAPEETIDTLRESLTEMDMAEPPRSVLITHNFLAQCKERWASIYAWLAYWRLSIAAGGILITILLSMLVMTRITANKTSPVPTDEVVLGKGTTVLASSGHSWQVRHTLTIQSSQTLRIQPGVTIVFAPDAGLIIRGGTLEAKGTADAPIVFTTGSNSPSGEADGQIANWLGIQSLAASDGTNARILLDNVILHYAGKSDGAAITCQDSALIFTHGLQSDSAGVGIRASNNCWGEIANDTLQHDAILAADITTPVLRFHDNVVLDAPVKLP
jgi:serine/threonine protein kinase